MGTWFSSPAAETVLCRQNTRNAPENHSNELNGYDIEAQISPHVSTCRSTTKHHSQQDLSQSAHNPEASAQLQGSQEQVEITSESHQTSTCNCHQLTNHHTAEEISLSFEDLLKNNHIGTDVTVASFQPAIHVWQTGPLSCNTIVIAHPVTKKGLLVDPGGDTFIEQGTGHKKRQKAIRVVDRIKELDIDITHIIITHAHFDHVLGLGSIRAGFPNAKVYLHRREKITWQFIPFQLSLMRMTVDPETLSTIGNPDVFFTPRLPAGLELPGEPTEAQKLQAMTPEQQTQYLSGDVNEIIDFLDCITLHTPGHSEGSICLYFPQSRLLCSGDTLFRDAIGRSDLNGGNPKDIRYSILTKLYTLPNNVNVIPGHGPETMIGREKGCNPVIKFGDSI